MLSCLSIKASSASSLNLLHRVPSLHSSLGPSLSQPSPCPPSASLASSRHLPPVLDVFIDEAGNEHGYQCIVPGANEHEGQAEAHAQEGESPGK